MTRSERGQSPRPGSVTADCPEVYAIVTGQGNLPHSLLESARAIVPDTAGVVAISNLDCPIEGLESRFEQTIKELPKGDVIIFTDMFGTSCANAGRELKRNHPHIVVLCGTNLAMLVRFLYHRHKKPFAELIPFLVETGRTAVRTVEL
jgi:mannose/fructose-specific phosphotransferase system component IIA